MAQQLSARQPRYKRILLKLSGEALMGSEEFGIDPKVLDRMALEIGQLVGIGVQVGLVKSIDMGKDYSSATADLAMDPRVEDMLLEGTESPRW